MAPQEPNADFLVWNTEGGCWEQGICWLQLGFNGQWEYNEFLTAGQNSTWRCCWATLPTLPLVIRGGRYCHCYSISWLFFHVKLSHRLPFFPIWYPKLCRARICSLLWWVPYPERVFRHCFSKGSFTLLCSTASKGRGKCSSSWLKGMRWWLAETVPPQAHARHQRTDASLPSGWTALHTCIH